MPEEAAESGAGGTRDVGLVALEGLLRHSFPFYPFQPMYHNGVVPEKAAECGGTRDTPCYSRTSAQIKDAHAVTPVMYLACLGPNQYFGGND